MTEIITRNTKGAELTYQEGDNQIAAPSRTTAVNLTLDETHNRETVVFNGASLVATLTAAGTLEPALNVTGGSDIVGYIVTFVNINSTDLRITSATNIDGSANDIYLPQYASITIIYDPTTNAYLTYARPNGVFTTNSNGNPNISDTSFLIAATITTDTWESVGPTGSSATNIYTGLDSVPLSVDWVEVRISLSIVAAAAAVATKIYGRGTGGAQVAGAANIIAGFFMGATGPTALQLDLIQSGIKLPVDSANRFDLQYTDQSTAPLSSQTLQLFVTGYGWNR